MPASLFYQHSEQLGITSPPGVESWESHNLGGWQSVQVDTEFTLEHFSRRVETSPEIQHLASLASQFGPQGAAMVLRSFEKALRAKGSDEDSAKAG